MPLLPIHIPQGGWLPGGHERTGRVAGLLEVFHRVDKSKGWDWTFGNLEGPFSSNIDGVHLADRYRASFWNRLRRHDYYNDAAKLFGRIPLQRLGAEYLYPNVEDVFHFLWEPSYLEDWQSRRAVEAVFHFHPNAMVYVHLVAPSVSDWGNLDIFVETGYNLKLLPYNPPTSTMKIDGISLDMSLLDKVKRLSVLAAILLHSHGGVYLSDRTYIRNTLPSNLELGYSLKSDGSVAMMKSKRGDTSILESLLAGGNELRFRTTGHDTMNSTQWDTTSISADHTLECVQDTTWELPDTNAVAVNLDAIDFQANPIVLDTECYRLVEKNCIYCDEVYWHYT